MSSRSADAADRIAAALPKNVCPEYRAASIREIIADFFGLMDSAEAFALALSGCVRFMSVSDEITTSGSCPCIKLRPAFLSDAIDSFGGKNKSISGMLKPTESFGKLGDEFA